MKAWKTRAEARKTTRNGSMTIEQQHARVIGNIDDLLIDPVEDLKRLYGTASLLASLGDSGREIHDTEHVLRFCELVEYQLESVISALVSIQEWASTTAVITQPNARLVLCIGRLP